MTVFNRTALAVAIVSLGVSGTVFAQGTAPSGSTPSTTTPPAATSPSTTSPSTTTTRSTTTSSKLDRADRKFIEEAAIGGMAEVALGNVAKDRGASDQVKQFGTRMVEDHTKANQELKTLADSKGVTLPAKLDAKHQRMVDRMQKMTGADFDRAYMKDMVSDHKKDVSDFQKIAKNGKDGDVKGFASKTLPTLQEHLKMAQDINDTVSKSASSGSARRTTTAPKTGG